MKLNSAGPGLHYCKRQLTVISAVILLAAIAFIHEGVYFPFREYFTDFSVYYASARAASQGLNPFERQAVAAELARLGISTGLNEYLYPAPFLLFLQPLLAFSLAAAHKIFLVIGYLSLSGSVLLLWRSLKKAGPGLPLWLLALIAIMFTPVWSNLAINQANILVLFLLCACFYFTVNRRLSAAGVMLGLAVMVKLMPLLLFAYFLARKQWCALTGGLAAILSLELASWAYFGRLLDLNLPGALLSHSARQLHYWVNMAVPALMVRATGLPGTGILKLIEILLVAAIGAPTVYFLLRFRSEAGPVSYVLFSLLITDFLIVQTILFTHHLVVLLIPFVMVLLLLTGTGIYAGRGRAMMLAALGISFALVEADYWRVWTAIDMQAWGWWAHPGSWGLVMLWFLQVAIIGVIGNRQSISMQQPRQRRTATKAGKAFQRILE